MKRLLVLIIAFTVSGCTAGGFLSKVTIPTGVPTSVTRPMLYDTENAAVVVFAGLNTYKRLCVNGAAPPTCRDVIRSMQVYTRALKINLVALRGFVRSGNQLDALDAYNAVTALIAEARALASANNMAVQ